MAQAPKISKYNLYLSSNFDMFFFFELIVYWTSSVIQANFFDQMCFQVNLIAVKLMQEVDLVDLLQSYYAAPVIVFYCDYFCYFHLHI